MSKVQSLIDYIMNELAVGRASNLNPDDDLFSSGLLDSLGVLQLVLFIEEQFGVEIPDEDVVFENFQSVNAITEYINAKDNAGTKS